MYLNLIIIKINPIIPMERLYCYRPYIYEIKELDNNKLLFYGSQRLYDYYKKYYFKIIFNYKKLDIEMAENIDYYDEHAWDEWIIFKFISLTFWKLNIFYLYNY